MGKSWLNGLSSDEIEQPTLDNAPSRSGLGVGLSGIFEREGGRADSAADGEDGAGDGLCGHGG